MLTQLSRLMVADNHGDIRCRFLSEPSSYATLAGDTRPLLQLGCRLPFTERKLDANPVNLYATHW